MLTALTTRYFERLIISALSILGRPPHLEKSRRSEYGLLQVQLECTLCLEPVLLIAAVHFRSILVPSWMDLGAADFKVDRLGSLQLLASITRASFVEWCVFVFPSP